MTAICDKVQIGRGTKVYAYSAGPKCGKQPEVTITITEPEAASAAQQTIVIGSAIAAANFFIPAGDFIEVEDPATGNIVLLQLFNDLKTGDTDIDVVSVPQAIADNSTITFPFVLKRRTGANINDTGAKAQSYAFEDGGYSVPKNTTREVPVDLSGDYAVFSAAFQNMRNRAQDGQYMFVTIEDPIPSAGYSKGEVIEGVFMVGNFPKNISSTEITKSDITGEFVGGYTRTLPVPII
jgi:hypothetical protein